MLIVQANSGQCRPEAIPAVVEGGAENCRSKWSAVGRVCIKPTLLKKGSIGWRARTRRGSFRGDELFAHSAARSNSSGLRAILRANAFGWLNKPAHTPPMPIGNLIGLG